MTQTPPLEAEMSSLENSLLDLIEGFRSDGEIEFEHYFSAMTALSNVQQQFVPGNEPVEQQEARTSKGSSRKRNISYRAFIARISAAEALLVQAIDNLNLGESADISADSNGDDEDAALSLTDTINHLSAKLDDDIVSSRAFATTAGAVCSRNRPLLSREGTVISDVARPDEFRDSHRLSRSSSRGAPAA